MIHSDSMIRKAKDRLLTILPFQDWRAKAWGAALITMLMILGLSVIVRSLTKGRFEFPK